MTEMSLNNPPTSIAANNHWCILIDVDICSDFSIFNGCLT